MRKSRFSEEQIIAILLEFKPGDNLFRKRHVLARVRHKNFELGAVLRRTRLHPRFPLKKFLLRNN